MSTAGSQTTGKPDHPLKGIVGLPDWLSVVSAYQTCERIMHRELGRIDLSIPQYDLLVCLLIEDGCTQRRLAERNMILKSNVSGLVQRMERDGLISRASDAQDARKKIVLLTDEGRSRVGKAVAIHKAIVEVMMSSVPAEQSRQIAESCQIMKQTLTDAFDHA